MRKLTKERCAQIGITIQFLVVVRALGEIFRLKHVSGSTFSIAMAMPFVTGALLAVCFCWAGVMFFFFRRYNITIWIAAVSIIILLVYKIVAIG